MVCIPAGKAIIGSSTALPNEHPRHTVELSTYYVDKYEVTNEQYAACEKAGGCPKRILSDPSFNQPRQPAVPLQWAYAHAFCLWAGKRMLSEAEWEKVARGGDDRRYPWGNQPPSCKRAHTNACSPHVTLPVGSLPAGPYGVFDMAGNGYEWVQDWASNCYDGCGMRACGKDCKGRDPLGPCAGAQECKHHSLRVLKGGSWFWSDKHIRTSWRRAAKPVSGVHRLSVRCGSSSATLSTWPPLSQTDPLPRPPDTAKPSAAELATFNAVPEEDDVLKIPPCKRVGDATVHCRDPHSYVVSNEPQQFRWLPYVSDLGGGYVGIGAAQNYSFIAAARSRWAWIFDYDPSVVRVHYTVRALLLAYDSPQKLIAALERSRLDETIALVQRSIKPDIAAGRLDKRELRLLKHEIPMAAKHLRKRFKTQLKPPAEHGDFGWLSSLERYRYVRTMLQQGRIQIRKGNLLTDKALPAIADSARQLGTYVRLLYTSNADDQWMVTPQYRANMATLPFDERSVVLRTIYPRNKPNKKVAPWDYVVHAGLDFQRRIAGERVKWLWWLSQQGRRHAPGNVVTIALPGRTTR